MATKKELQQWLDDALPRVGGVKLARMDSNRMMRGNTSGLSDDIWIVHGHLFFIELKSDHDFPSDNQIDFMIQILTKTCRHVHYILLEKFEQIEEIMNYVPTREIGD